MIAEVALALALGAATCHFPGPSTQCAGSRAGIAIEWREANADHEHQLWLQRSADAPVLLAEFGRSADVLWSPDGAAVAITDHAGSSDATAWIVRISSPKERESLEAAFNRAFGRPEEIYRHGHRYVRALSWQSPTSLLFEVQAHDAGPEWYRAQFSYTAGVVRPVETP